MKILGLVVGIWLLIAGSALYVLEYGVDDNKSHAHNTIISHLSIIIVGVLVGIGRL